MAETITPNSPVTDADWEAQIAAARTAKALTEPAVEEVTPSKEEPQLSKVESEEIFAAVRNTVPTVIEGSGILLGDLDSINERFAKFANLTEDQRIALSDKKDPEFIKFLWTIAAQERLSINAAIMVSSLERLKEEVGDLKKTLRPAANDKKTRSYKARGEVFGKDARLAVIAAMRGLQRVYLYNSGFSITIRAFDLSELSQFFNSIDLQREELGRQIGQASHFLTDIFIRSKFMEVFPSIVVNSNFDEWNDDDALIRNISAQDYDVLVWAACTLMFASTGYELPMRCMSKTCDYRADHITIDVNELRIDNLTMLNTSQVEFVLSSKTRTEQELITYRDSITKCTKLLPVAAPKESPVKTLEYTLAVPTMDRVIRCGETLANGIIARIQTTKSMKNTKLYTEYVRHLDRMLLPWIKSINFLDEKHATLFTVTEEEAILETLIDDTHDEDQFNERVVQFIMDTRISHFCYTDMACPKCGVGPVIGAVDEFTPVDMGYLFFDHTYRRLAGVAPIRSSNDTSTE